MRKLISLILIIWILVSCKKEKKNEVSENISDQIEYVSQLPYKFEFPDTVYINKNYSGKLTYNGQLDTLKLPYGEERFIIYYLTITNKLLTKISDLKKVKSDTFGGIDKHTVPFYNIKFDKLGENYIDGLIDDSAYLNVPTKKDKFRTITNITRATHKVYVINNGDVKRN